jgi:thiamine biosynthesis lipoprotein
MTFGSASFRAMGTDVEVLAAPSLAGGVADAVRALFEDVESRLSRFRPESELSLMNLSAGRPFAASPLMLEVVRAALAAARKSGGLFDPLVLHDVEAAGYRVSLEQIGSSMQVQTPVEARARIEDVVVSGDGTIAMPAGAGIDLGGFAKGWTVDRAVRLMAGCESWLVNAGGDLRCHGGGPSGSGWLVGVEDPFSPGSDVATLSVRDCAVATSSTMRRRWRTSTGFAHHLVDPRTGRPSETDLVSVTVIAGTAAQAEVLAKTLLLRGKRQATEHASAEGIAMLAVDGMGLVEVSEGMEGYVVV